jgi:hypothetical protein
MQMQQQHAIQSGITASESPGAQAWGTLEDSSQFPLATQAVGDVFGLVTSMLSKLYIQKHCA